MRPNICFRLSLDPFVSVMREVKESTYCISKGNVQIEIHQIQT